MTTDSQADRPWRDVADECAEFDDEGNICAVPGGFGGESEKHMMKKLIVAHILDEIGDYESVRLESTSPSGIQYDVFASGGESEPVVAEVGDVNTPIRKLDDRMRLTYQDATGIIFWPHSTEREVRLIADGIASRPPSCSECGTYFPATTFGPFPVSFDRGLSLSSTDVCNQDGHATLVSLEHLFDPDLYHARLQRLDGGNDNSWIGRDETINPND